MLAIYPLHNDPAKAAKNIADAHLDVLLNERVKMLGYIFARHQDEPEKVLSSAMVAYSDKQAFYVVVLGPEGNKKPHHVEIPRYNGDDSELGLKWCGETYANLYWTIVNTYHLALERKHRFKKEHKHHKLYVDWCMRATSYNWEEHTTFPDLKVKLDELFAFISWYMPFYNHIPDVSSNDFYVLMTRIYYAYNLVRFGSYNRLMNKPSWLIELRPHINKLRGSIAKNESLDNAARKFVTDLIKEFPHPLTDLTQ